MTYKEAVDWMSCLRNVSEFDVSNMLGTWYKGVKNDFDKVVDMAIEALEALNRSEIPNNSDCISRVAAIAAADRADYTGLAVEDVKKVTDEVVKELKQLPSVQSEIIHCKDCIWHNKDINQCDRQVCAVMYANDFCSYGERRGEQDE